jgi:IS30 family transposase
MSFKHLSLTERHYIELESKNGTSMNKIAKKLNRSQGSISREIKRNIGQKGYRHKQAHSHSIERHKTKTKQIKLTEDITILIDKYIREKWSPEQIAGRFKKDNVITIHHETIYKYILKDKKSGGDLYTHLRHQNKTYRKRYGHPRSRSGIPNRVDIDERPKVVDSRKRVGDWEFDTIIGKNHKGAIVTMDERKSKLRLAYPLPSKKGWPVIEAMKKLLKPIKEFVHTATFDNGKEFTHHESFAKELNCDTYFAKPYHSWERGQNENANGLLRQYFPKNMELNEVSEKEVYYAVDKLNSRPRKILNYLTPYEAFEKFTGINIKKLQGYAFMT